MEKQPFIEEINREVVSNKVEIERAICQKNGILG